MICTALRHTCTTVMLQEMIAQVPNQIGYSEDNSSDLISQHIADIKIKCLQLKHMEISVVVYRIKFYF